MKAPYLQHAFKSIGIQCTFCGSKAKLNKSLRKLTAFEEIEINFLLKFRGWDILFSKEENWLDSISEEIQNQHLFGSISADIK